MKTKIFTILVVLTVFFAFSCETPDENTNNDVVFLSLTADGSVNLTTTTLTLAFDKTIGGLSVEDITLTAGSTGAVKDSLSYITVGKYELKIKDVSSGGIVSVFVANKPYQTITGGPKQVTIYYKQVSGNGNGNGDGDGDGDVDIPSGLVAKWYTHQNLADAGGDPATLEFTSDGKLLYMGVNNQLTISVNGNVITIYRSKVKVGTVNYTISGTALNFSNVTGETILSPEIPYYKKGVTPVIKDIDVNFSSLLANGSSGANWTQPAITTKLTLNFNKDIESLNAADITLDAGTTGATKGTLNRIEYGKYELTLTGIIAGGPVIVSVSKDGYNVTGNSTNLTAGSRQVTVFF